MVKRLGLGWRIGGAVAGVSVFAVLATFLSGYMVTESVVDDIARIELQKVSKRFTARLDVQSRRALDLAAFVAEMELVQRAMAENDREVLRSTFLPQFLDLKTKLGVTQFQFHKAPATSFYRVHKDGKYGDDLSGFRHTVISVNTDGKPVSGIERGRAGVGARGVVPVVYQGKQVGSVEFGLTAGAKLFEKFSTLTGTKVSVFLASQNDPTGFDKAKADGQADFVFLGGTVPDTAQIKPSELAAAMRAPQYKNLELEGIPFSMMLSPLLDYAGKPIGTIAVMQDQSHFVSQLEAAQLRGGGVAAAMIAVALLVTGLLHRLIVRPLQSLSDSMNELAQGNLNVELPIRKQNDEIADMLGTVKVFQSNARQVEELQAEQEKHKRDVELERCRVLNRTANEFEQNVGGVISAVTEAVAALQDASTEMHHIAEEANLRIERVASASEEASSNVQSVSSSAEQLASAIREIAEQVAKSTEVANKAVSSADSTSHAIANLSQSVDQIGEIVSLINDIADKTNLLALNATIEAARAGDAGKGFAIVASEVKNLAHQTSKATEDISAQIERVQMQTTAAVDAIEGISHVIGDVRDITVSIAAAVDEQSSATNEIARSVEQASGGTTTVSRNINGVRDAAAQTDKAAAQIEASATDLAGQAKRLQDEVADYLSHVRS